MRPTCAVMTESDPLVRKALKLPNGSQTAILAISFAAQSATSTPTSARMAARATKTQKVSSPAGGCMTEINYDANNEMGTC